MTTDTTILREALQEQLAVCGDLQRLLEDEQQAIVGLDTTRMGQLNSQKEAVIARQMRAADALRDALATLSRQSGGALAQHVSELLPRLPRESAKELAALQQAVQASGAAVQAQAHYNRGLLEPFLATVNDSLAFLLRVLNASNQYGSSGSYLQRAQAGAVMVNREA